VKARGLLRELDSEDGRKVPTVSNPIVFSSTSEKVVRPSPLLGQDTDGVMKNVLGLSIDKLKELREAQVID
jgi:crotonobetainyl-CoA:carnitine CoA-transferase CaiB-like acyl-CoA transferase